MAASSALGYVIGTFDMLNVAHLSVLNQVRDRCDVLVIGVLSDDDVARETGLRPITPVTDRCEVLRNLRAVDEVVEHDPSWTAEHPDATVFAFGDRHDVRVDDVVRPVEYPANGLLWTSDLLSRVG